MTDGTDFGVNINSCALRLSAKRSQRLSSADAKRQIASATLNCAILLALRHSRTNKWAITRGILTGDRFYKTQVAAIAAIRTVRANIVRTGTVSDEDDGFLRDLIDLHPRVATKVGPGIKRFEVRRIYEHLGFWIIRIDGTDVDFSFNTCLKSPTPKALILSAMRYSVIDQKTAARERAFGSSHVLSCPIHKEIVITRDKCHVDHYNPTFLQLADAFAIEHGGYEHIATISEDGDIGRRFQEAAIDAAWRTYHAANARMRVISREANLGTARRQPPNLDFFQNDGGA